MERVFKIVWAAMEKIEFSKDWANLFSQNGLRTVDDFFEFNKGEIINRNSKRNVMTFELEDDNGKERFFMKRFYKPHFKDMLASFMNFKKICSQACTEFNNVQKLSEIAIPSYEPVCFGRVMQGPIEKRSVFITRELPGVCLTDYLAEKWNTFTRPEKETLLTEMVALMVRAHKAKLSLPDIYVWHYWVMADQPNFSLGKIDLHMTKHNASVNDQIRDLGALHFSMNNNYFTEEDREFVLDKYFELSEKNKSKLYDKIIARSTKVSSRRRLPKY